VQIAFALGQRRSRRDALRERERERKLDDGRLAPARGARRIGNRREDGAERKRRTGPAEAEPRGARGRRAGQT